MMGTYIVPRTFQGAKGGKGGGGSSRVAKEDPNSLRANSVAKLVDLISEGPIVGLVNGLKSVFLDETPVQNSDGSFNAYGLVLVTREGYPDQTVIPGLNSIEAETDVSAEVRKDTPIIRTITNAEASALVVKVQVAALTEQNKSNGDLKGSSVQIAIDVKLNSSSTWTQAVLDTIKGKTTSPYQRQYRVELPGTGPTWQVRVRRLTDDDQGSHIQNATYFTSLTEVIDARLSYPDSALVGLKVDARQFGSSVPTRAYHIKGMIIDVPSNYDPVKRTYTGEWNGAFKKAWTNNPAWIYHDVAKSKRYGAGQDNLDKWALYYIGKYCDELVSDGLGGQEPRFTCNLVINTQEDAYVVLDSIASIFRGMSYWASSRIMPVADRPGTASRIFTRANIIGDFNYTGTGMKARHSVVLVSWNDPDDFFRQTIELVEDPQMIAQYGWRQKDITAFGCSSRGQARRLGKWLMYSEKYETESITFTANSDAYDVRPGDLILVSDPAVAGKRLGGRLLNATSTTKLQLDKVPEGVTTSWTLTVALPLGSETRAIKSISGDWIELKTPLTSMPVTEAVWMLQSTAVTPVTFRVLSVSEGSEPMTYSITGMMHYPGKYAFVENGEPLPDRQVSLIPTGKLAAPSNVSMSAFTYLAGGLSHQGLTVSWADSGDPRTQAYELEVMGPGDLNWREVYSGGSLSYDLRDVDAGEWQARVRGRDGIGRYSAWAVRNQVVTNTLLPEAPTSIEIDIGTMTIGLRPQGGRYGQLWEFYRSNVALATNKILSNGVLLGRSTEIVDTERAPATTYYYYVRGYNAYGVSDWLPAQATTNADATALLQVLNQKLTTSQLHSTLSSEVAKISGPQSLAGSVANKIAVETTNRINALTQVANDRAAAITASEAGLRSELTQAVATEAAARVAAITKEQGDRAAAITSEKNARTTAINSVVTSLTALTAAHNKTIADLSSEVTTRASEDTALVTRMDGLFAQAGSNLSAAIAAEQTARVSGDSAVASGLASLEARFDRAPSWVSSFESGVDFTQWTVSGTSTITVSTDNYSGEQSALIKHGATTPSSSGTTGGVRAALPEGTAIALAGLRVKVSFYAKKPTSNAATEFAVAYSTGEAASSGWQRFNATTAWAKYEFNYDLPVPTTSALDYIAIWGDTANSGKGVLIDLVSVNPVTSSEDLPEITAAIQQEATARATAIEGLSTTINTVKAKADTNAAAITTEKNARISAVAAVTSSITTLTATVNKNTADISSESTARADALAAVTSQVNTVLAKTDTNAAAITTEKNARTTAVNSLTTQVNSVLSKANANTASITAESTARTDAIASVTSQINSVLAKTDANTAAINTEKTTRADAVSAVSQKIDDVVATVSSGTNLLRDPSLTDLGQWLKNGTAGSSAEITTDVGDLIAAKALLVKATITTASNSTYAGALDQIVNVVAGQNYMCSADVYGATGSQGDMQIQVIWYNKTGGQISYMGTTGFTTKATLPCAVTRLEMRGQAPASAVTARIRLRFGVATNGATFKGWARFANPAFRESVLDMETAAAVKTETQARIDAVSGVASQVTTLGTQLTSAYTAAIKVEETARISKETAITNQINTLQVQVGQNIAAVESAANAQYNSLSGKFNASYMLRTDVKGYVAGYGLSNDGTTSQFIVRSDIFAVASPGTNVKEYPFIISDGKVVMKETLIESLNFNKLRASDGSLVFESGKLKSSLIDVNKLSVKEAATFVGDAFSANYVAGKSGWAILKNGYVEFNEAMIRGNLEVQSVTVNGNSPSSTVRAFRDDVEWITWAPDGSTSGDKSGTYSATTTVTGVPQGAKFDLVLYPKVKMDYSMTTGVGDYTPGVDFKVDVTLFANNVEIYSMAQWRYQLSGEKRGAYTVAKEHPNYDGKTLVWYSDKTYDSLQLKLQVAITLVHRLADNSNRTGSRFTMDFDGSNIVTGVLSRLG